MMRSLTMFSLPTGTSYSHMKRSRYQGHALTMSLLRNKPSDEQKRLLHVTSSVKKKRASSESKNG